MAYAQPTSATSPEVALFIPEFKPSLTDLDKIYQQFLRVIALGQEWKRIVPLMTYINNLDVAHSGKLTFDEIQEAVDELQKDEIQKFLAEWADSLNVLAGLAFAKNLDIHFQSAVVAYVNGQGRSSSVFEQAQEIALNLPSQSEKLQKDITQIFILMLSALIHAPQFTENLVDLALQKMQDNLQNYPTELFGMEDENGKALSPELLQQKYNHIVRCLKWLRSLYQPGRMLPEDWRAVKPEIMAFQSSDESFRMLQTRWFELHPETLAVIVPEKTEMPQQVTGDIPYDFEGVPNYV